MQFRVYPYDYINNDEVLKKGTEIAIVYDPWPNYITENEEYHNIKKIHIFTSIDYKDDVKYFENDSRYKIWFIDDRDPFKDCDVKFDYIQLDSLKDEEFLNMKILNDAINHLKDENSIIVKTNYDDLMIIKMPKK